MGSSSSKAVAASGRGCASRKFPSRALGAAAPPRNAQHARTSPPQRDDVGDQEIRGDADADAADLVLSGDFSQRLHSMGIAQPNPTFSQSSQAAQSPSHSASQAYLFPAAPNNTTLSVLEARRLFQQQADKDLEKLGRCESIGRRFLDMRTLLDAVEMRDRGALNSDIERRLVLKPGIIDKLGPPSMLSHLLIR